MARNRYGALAATMFLALVFAPVSSQARELAVDPDELVAVELATVGMDRLSGTPLVLLREPRSGDVVPIVIGMAEARAILMAMHEVQVPRPMTHDLLSSVVMAADARLLRVFVDDLVDGTYLGILELEVPGRQEPVLVDTRPSDGLALAMRTGATIHVAPKILQAGEGLEFEGLADDQVVTAIGITVVEATAELREALDLPDREGVLVSRTTGTAADKGMTAGGMILEVNGETPLEPMDFLHLVRATSGDEDARILYWQDGEEHEIGLSTAVPGPSGAERLQSL